MRFNKKRLAFAAGLLATVGAIGTLVAGVTFGLFSATTPTQSNTFTAGTVTLTQPVSTSCAITKLVPGDQTTGYIPANAGGQTNTAVAQCKLQVTYGGTVPANLGLDVAVTGTAGSPVQAYAPGNTGLTPTAAPGLYDGTSNGLQVELTDSIDYTSYWSGTTVNGGAFAGPASSINDLLVAKAALNGTSVTFTVDYALPTAANNAYQSAASTITLTAHAVQSGNNGDTNLCTLGHTCAGITGWS
jgi:predicted ribosomally synthesized peptide with SipW-like signal peptide